MTDTNDAALGGSEPAPIAIPEHKTAGDGPLTAREAARSVNDWRHKRAAGETTQEESAEPAPTAQESEPQGEDTAPLEEATGETQEPDPVEIPPLERPRSWTKEQDEHWKALPRATQEYLIERASQDSAEVRRSQNEAAEQRKVIAAEHAQVAQARAQYEAALPILQANLQASYEGEFSDIKTMQDVQRLAVDDPVRYTRWDAAQKQIAMVQHELAGSQQRQDQEDRDKFKSFQTREITKFAELVPEMADPEKRTKLINSCAEALKSVKFSDDELGRLWRGDNSLSVHDHRFQLILRDAVRYREKVAAEESARNKLVEHKKPVPPVQRPGAAQGKGAAQEARIKNLTQKLDNASGNNALKVAAALLTARRQAAR